MAAGLAAVFAVLIWTQQELSVVVYNNTSQPFGNVTVSAGAERREMPALGVDESASFSFRAVVAPADVQLLIDTDPSLRWNAPSLATPSTSRLTLRVDQFGGVTVTVEKTWRAQCSDWLQ
ncbi:MAG: hypothetical protein WCP06_01675 [Verrucomicrobiota bacterium]